MKNIQVFATALLLTISLFCTNNLSAQWVQTSTSIWTTNLNANVGIGTSTPTSAKLQFANSVGNKITLFDEGGGNGYGFGINGNNLCAYIPGAAGYRFSVRANSYSGAEKFVVTSGGQAFVGDGSNNGILDLGFGGNGSGEGIGSKRTAGGNQFGLDFYTQNGTNRMSITNSGNVGIGTTSPTAKFEVNLLNANGWNGNKKAARFVAPDNGYYLDLNTYIVANGNVGYQFSPNGNTGLCISTPGNVGIGTTTPTTKLQVHGGDGLSLGFGPSPTGEGIGSKRTAGGNQWGLDFYTNSATRMSITNAGNVGIGTSAPAYKLHVLGDIRCYNLYTNSDRRYKTNIQTLGGAMDKVMAMRGTTYDFVANRLPEGYKADKQVGLIAQEMEAVMPELVSEDAEGMKSINYIGVIPVLVEALKEQHEVIEEKETRIAALEAQNTELQTRLARIEAALGIAADRQTEVKTAPVSAKVSPNPTSGLVTIDLQNTATAKSVVVNIVDAAGRQVATRNAAGTSSLQFDLSQLPAGVYVAQIVADGKMVSSNKVQLVK